MSPTNKLPGKGRKLYRKKRKEVIAAGASLVEIDLNRFGQAIIGRADGTAAPMATDDLHGLHYARMEALRGRALSAASCGAAPCTADPVT